MQKTYYVSLMRMELLPLPLGVDEVFELEPLDEDKFDPRRIQVRKSAYSCAAILAKLDVDHSPSIR